jgi:hypothetical protein
MALLSSLLPLLLLLQGGFFFPEFFGFPEPFYPEALPQLDLRHPAPTSGEAGSPPLDPPGKAMTPLLVSMFTPEELKFIQQTRWWRSS